MTEPRTLNSIVEAIRRANPKAPKRQLYDILLEKLDHDLEAVRAITHEIISDFVKESGDEYDLTDFGFDEIEQLMVEWAARKQLRLSLETIARLNATKVN